MRFIALVLVMLLPLATAEGAGLLDRSANRLPDIVDQDNGGNLLKRLDFIDAHRNDYLYRLPVECFSSCTLLLGISGACVMQGAKLYFHAATVDGKIAPAYLTTYIENYYPPAIREWVVAHHALQKTQFTAMDWQQAAALGVKVCH